jgi:hypothetical protein
MRKVARYLHFQKEQDGVLTLPDAAQLLKTNTSMVDKWARQKRIAYCTHRGRRYFGMKSLREWMMFHHSYNVFRQVQHDAFPDPNPDAKPVPPQWSPEAQNAFKIPVWNKKTGYFHQDNNPFNGTNSIPPKHRPRA